jgi:hypothetical protein
MSIAVRAYANADDALIAWRPKPWSDEWVGFALWKRDLKSGAETPINNRIPPKEGAGPVPDDGISSLLSPIRRCIWFDHSINAGDRMQYRVVPVVAAGGNFQAVDAEASDWGDPIEASAESGAGLAGIFNRGIIMSQVVSRFAQGEVTVARLKKLKSQLATPGFPMRRHLAGQVRHELLDFLSQALKRGSEIYAALYEANDEELIQAIEAFGPVGHVLLGNGSAMLDGLADRLAKARLEVKTRDLSKAGRSSPSVHNKFVVEVQPHAGPTRVLTGSTNWRSRVCAHS